jgi:hypothetical protein
MIDDIANGIPGSVGAAIGSAIVTFLLGVVYFSVTFILSDDPLNWLKSRVPSLRNRIYIVSLIWTMFIIIGTRLFGLWGTDDGKPIFAQIAVESVGLKPRIPTLPAPFAVNVHFRPVTGAHIVKACHQAIILPSHDIAKNEELDKIFKYLSKQSDLVDFSICPPVEGDMYFTIYPDGVIPDSIIDDLYNERQYLYILVVWKYQIEGSKKLYNQETCTYYFGPPAQHSCAGKHNRTFNHT